MLHAPGQIHAIQGIERNSLALRRHGANYTLSAVIGSPYAGAMSNHSEPPVVPVEAYDPPYYAAVFTTVRTQDQSGYSETSARMEDLVKDVPGFLGIDHAQTPGGLSITVGYFRDAEALNAWRCNPEHRAAQKRGQAEWYQSYTLHVAKVERSHRFIRP